MRYLVFWALILAPTLHAETSFVPSSYGRLEIPKKMTGLYTRSQVLDTTVFPYRIIGQLQDGCTGTIIGPKQVLTAAHCVYNFRNQSWNENLKFFPGKTSETNVPYGVVNWKKVMVQEEYLESGDNAHDFAVIETVEDIGNTLGWSGFKAFQENEYVNNVRITGYPADKPAGTMWTVSCPVSLEKTTMNYLCDTYGGMSGSGVFSIQKDPNVFFITGVHTFGGEVSNGGVMLDSKNFELVRSWRNDTTFSDNTIVHEKPETQLQ